MKKIIHTYITTLLIFLIPFTLISFILATLSYFIQTNSFMMNIIIQMISYALLIISALYLSSQLTEKRLTHCFFISILYFLCSLLIHLGNLNYWHLLFKSILFIVIGFIKEIKHEH